MDGKTGRGSPRMEWISQITKDMDMGSCRDLKELSFDQRPTERLKTKKINIHLYIIKSMVYCLYRILYVLRNKRICNITSNNCNKVDIILCVRV